MSERNSSKTILVTGASSGIGKASVIALLAQGFQVFAGVRNEAAGERLRADVHDIANADAARLQLVTLDITQPEQIQSAVARISEAVGPAGLWGLHNNAGISVSGPLEFLAMDDLRWQMEVNVIGQVALTQACLPLLRQARGRVVSTGSVAGFNALPGLGAYAMSKHALEAFSDALRREVRPWGIEVVLIQPGVTQSEIWSKGEADVEAQLGRQPPSFVELYGPLVKGLQKGVAASLPHASPASVVAAAAVHAFSAARPKTRYLVGYSSGQKKFLSLLPSRWADALIAKKLGTA